MDYMHMSYMDAPDEMEWMTFEGDVKRLDEIDHQHLSNIHYWTHLVMPVYERDIKALICEQLDARFDGQLLDYKPLRRFANEMRTLKRRGWLLEDNDRTLVVVDGDVIGEVDETPHS